MKCDGGAKKRETKGAAWRNTSRAYIYFSHSGRDLREHVDESMTVLIDATRWSGKGAAESGAGKFITAGNLAAGNFSIFPAEKKDANGMAGDAELVFTATAKVDLACLCLLLNKNLGFSDSNWIYISHL